MAALFDGSPNFSGAPPIIGVGLPALFCLKS